MKNKYQEAYDRLAFNFGLDVVNGTEYDDEVNDFILFKKLVNKATPKKPIDESLVYKLCPTCEAYLNFDALNDPVKYAPKYCSNCGQRIDWGKDETD